MAANSSASNALRLDKLLWHLRLCKSRSFAQSWIDEGHIRVNGKRAERSAQLVHVGDVITLPRGDTAMAIKIEIIPARRGPSAEAGSHYLCL